MSNNIEIPAEFYSFDTGQPFCECIECGKNLLADDCEYVIEKAVRNYPGFTAKDVIFDYAICLPCAMEIQKRISTESMQAIQKYLSSKLEGGDIMTKSGNLDTCIFSNRKIADCTEYQLFAYCRGRHLHEYIKPYVVSGEILTELSDLLSAKTRDEMNGFMNKHFPTSPFIKEPDPRLIIF